MKTSKSTIQTNHAVTATLASVSTLALLAASPAATAQDQDDNPRTLSTVTVTATQRTASVQDVPIAVTALDPEALDRAGVSDISNLDSLASSFNMNSAGTVSGGTTLRIRGVGTTGNNIGLESSVGVFLDGVYLSRPGVALGDLLDLEQIEVLRGPQGTLFGRNTSAGALNIKTKKPNLRDYEGFGNLTIGNYNLVNLQAGINLPIVEDKFAVRLSGAIHDRDGFVEGLNGDESHDRDRYTVRGQALWDLGAGGTLRAIADYSEAEERCCQAVWFSDTSIAAVFGPAGLDPAGGAPNVGPTALDNLRSNDGEFLNPFEQMGLSIEYNVDTPLGDLTYIGAYRDYESRQALSTDYTGLRLFTAGASAEAVALGGTNFDPESNLTTIETTTHELRLQNTAFDDRLDWLVGLYYSDEEITTGGSVTLLDEYQAGVSAGLLGQTANLLLAFSGGAPATGDFADNAFAQDGESFSIFTHNIFSVTDRVDLTVGIRYVEESKDGSFTQLRGQHNACFGTLGNLANVPVPLSGAAVGLNCFVFTAPVYDPNNPGQLFGAITASPAAPLLAFLPQEFDDTFEDEEVVYTIKGSYALTDDINVYGGFTHGFKSGGFNLDPSAAAGGIDPRFDSELIDVWEFGVKADLFDGRARANLSVFQQDLEGFQVLEFTGIQFRTFNVGKAEATGFELEPEAALTDTVLGNLSIAYTDASYPNDCDVKTPGAPGFNANSANLCGNSLTNAPEWVIVGGATYENQFNGLNFFANANFRYEDDRRTSTQPTELLMPNMLLPGDIQDANTKINLRVGLSTEDERWAIELWGRNVTDEQTVNSTFTVPLRGAAGNRSRAQFTQDPATYGVTLRTKF